MKYVIGASIAGMVLAERLHRRNEKVTLIAGGPPEPKRLIDGCSLRRGAVHVLEHVFQTGTLWSELSGDGQADFFGTQLQEFAKDGTPRGPMAKFSQKKPVGLSTRHGHILSVLKKHLTAPTIASNVQRIEAGQILLDGKALIIDDAVFNTLRTPFGASAPKPSRFVVAVQAPMKGSAPPMGFGPFLDGHMGFVTPFFDPATPEATHYTISTRIVKSRDDNDISLAEENMLQMARMHNLTPVNLAQTKGRACVPVTESFDLLQSEFANVFNLSDVFSSGAPAINVDGMLAQARGALAFADNFYLGIEPALRAVKKDLAQVRQFNKGIVKGFFESSAFTRKIQLVMMKPVMPWLGNFWTNLGAQNL